jgi:hypothetical protein
MAHMKQRSGTVGFRLPLDTFDLLSRRARQSGRSSGEVARSLVESGLTDSVAAELSALREAVLALQGQVRALARHPPPAYSAAREAGFAAERSRLAREQREWLESNTEVPRSETIPILK